MYVLITVEACPPANLISRQTLNKVKKFTVETLVSQVVAEALVQVLRAACECVQ